MSTAMLTQQPSPVTMPAAVAAAAAAAAPSSPTKKRRRRAPATGAAEDCFSCRSVGIKCDRRRPYCGPCLDTNQLCKGYRTQLTWGVGVASRGKLRGLSLPVLNAVTEQQRKDRIAKQREEKAGLADEKAKRSRTAGAGTPGYGSVAHRNPTPASSCSSSVPTASNASSNSSGKLSIITSYDFVNMELPSSGAHSHAPHSAPLSRSGLPSRMGQESRSPPSSLSSPYSAVSQQGYRSPLPPSPPQPQHHQHHQHHQHQQSPQQQQQQHQHHQQQQQQQQHQQTQHYQTSPQSNTQYHKSPYSHVSMPPQQQQAPSMLLSPMSEYEPSFPGPHNYPMSSAPSSAPLYEIVSGVSSASYNSPSMTVTSSGVAYAPMTATMHAPAPRMMHSGLSSNGQQSWSNGQNNNGGGSLHHQQAPSGHSNLSDLLYDEDMLAPAGSNITFNGLSNNSSNYNASIRQQQHQQEVFQRQNSVSFVDPALSPPQLSDLPSSLRYLIDYYDRAICPVMVVFDGHNNPFRQHIIPMAFSNPALMEAIFALSESHLQSRKKMSLLTMARDEHTRSLTPISQGSPPPQDYRGPSMLSSVAPDNALHHKNSSTRLLQDQLNDPVLSKDDEASATLLILQLYHLCDTGIGNFKTHLAGVKRLMMMREVGKETGRWAWMETVFCWLDNMCASINNCEGQLRGGYLDMIRESTDDWSIESLVGCDRDLFACLAGLARINMLSQAPVCPGSGDMDDNEDDGESEPVRNERDGRTDFWLAWNAMKAHLYEWRPTTLHAATWSRINPGELTSPRESPRSPGGSPGPSIRSPPVAHLRAQEAVEVNHWLHACNVFRYAAILYLHRLAYPHLPSSHSIFQNTVREVLDHIACIPASGGLGSKLLWPLFITGSECVVEGHRRIIRERCQDMMRESGFFNKFAGLDVLEKIWRRDDEDEARGCNDEVDMFAGSRRMGRGENRGIGGRGLRWRRVIAGEEMEYLMV